MLCFSTVETFILSYRVVGYSSNRLAVLGNLPIGTRGKELLGDKLFVPGMGWICLVKGVSIADPPVLWMQTAKMQESHSLLGIDL